MSAGARVAYLDGTGDLLVPALSMLPGLGITSLMLEGGPTLHAAAWAADVVDRVQVFRTPCVLQPGGVRWLDDTTFELDHLEDVTTTTLGSDVLIEGYVHRAD